MIPAREFKALALATIGLLLIAALGCSDDPVDDPPAGGSFTFQHGGLSRSYQLYLPGGLPADAPLIMVLHGMGSTSDWANQ
jgi:polyhydroxybutyrate depolymerase